MSAVERGRLARFAGSIVAVVALVVVVPTGLMAVSQARFGSANPLAGVRPPWRWGVNEVSEAISRPLRDDAVVNLFIRGALCVLWVCLVVVVLTTVAEFVHIARHSGLAMPQMRGIGWAQPFSRYIATGLLVLLPHFASRAAVADGPATLAERSTQLSIATSLPSTAGNASITSRSYASTPLPSDDNGIVAIGERSTLHLVQRGESVWSIAATYGAGDDSRTAQVADEILDLNLGSTMPDGQRFTNPAYIQIGWELVLPSGLRPTEPSRGELPASDPEAAQLTPATTVVVEAGDSLSELAGDQWGDESQWPAIWEVNANKTMNDGHVFDDPNLIQPGWALDIPDDPDQPVRLDTSTAVEDGPIIDLTTPRAPTSAPSPESTAPEPTADSPTQPVLPTATTTSTTTSTSTTPPAAVDGSGGADRPDESVPGPNAPSPIRFEHAALLAAGVLALVGVRRRQRLRAARPRVRVPEPRADLVATERRLRTIDAGERAARTDVAIRAVARQLVGHGTQIGIIMSDTDGDLEVVLTAPHPPTAPWDTVDGDPQRWYLPAAVPIEMLVDDARQVATPCIALVQLGVSDEGRDVLVDLEAFGTLAIDADDHNASEVVNALAAGLAVSEYAEVAHLITVSIPDQVVLGHRNAHRVDSVDAAFDLAVSLIGTTLTEERTSFELRSLRTGGEVWEPAVILFDARDAPAALSGGRLVPRVGHGLAVVLPAASGSIADAGGCLRGTGDGWELRAFNASIAMTPIGLSSSDLDAVTAILDDAMTPLIDIEVDDVALVDSGTDAGDPGGAHEFTPLAHELVVRLLGSVDVIDADGSPGRFERSKTVELIAWLATHRDRSTRTAARTALWELDVRDATFANVVSEARRALARLVEPPGDTEWVARTLNEQLPLHSGVVTDADLVAERMRLARLQPPDQAIDTLRPAVAMIRDMPFAGTSYLWPDAEGITSNLVLLATGAAAELAGHGLSIGDTELVFWATGQGLKVLPGHEELIALRMRAHARAGDLAGVRQEWQSYERVIVADPWSDGEPAPKLLALRRELLSPTSST